MGFEPTKSELQGIGDNLPQPMYHRTVPKTTTGVTLIIHIYHVIHPQGQLKLVLVLEYTRWNNLHMNLSDICPWSRNKKWGGQDCLVLDTP